MSIKRNKATLSIEYAMLIAMVVIVLGVMASYFIRALSGRWRQAADTFGHGRQYDPGAEQEK